MKKSTIIIIILVIALLLIPFFYGMGLVLASDGSQSLMTTEKVLEKVNVDEDFQYYEDQSYLSM